jgi:hypothetical protein
MYLQSRIDPIARQKNFTLTTIMPTSAGQVISSFDFAAAKR